MQLEEKQFNSNNTVHFTSVEFARYKQLEGIIQDTLKEYNIGFNQLIVQTADEILGFVINSDYLIVNCPEGEKEVVLPLVNRTYTEPIVFGVLDNSGEYTYHSDFDVDLPEDIFESLKKVKPKYLRAIMERSEAQPDSGTDDFSEIFEIGLVYLNGLTSLAQKPPFSMTILDKNREPTKKIFCAGAIMAGVTSRAAKELEYEARVQEAIIEIFGCGTPENLPVYNKKIDYEEKMIEARKQRKEKD